MEYRDIIFNLKGQKITRIDNASQAIVEGAENFIRITVNGAVEEDPSFFKVQFVFNGNIEQTATTTFDGDNFSSVFEIDDGLAQDILKSPGFTFSVVEFINSKVITSNIVPIYVYNERPVTALSWNDDSYIDARTAREKSEEAIAIAEEAMTSVRQMTTMMENITTTIGSLEDRMDDVDDTITSFNNTLIDYNTTISSFINTTTSSYNTLSSSIGSLNSRTNLLEEKTTRWVKGLGVTEDGWKYVSFNGDNNIPRFIAWKRAEFFIPLTTEVTTRNWPVCPTQTFHNSSEIVGWFNICTIPKSLCTTITGFNAIGEFCAGEPGGFDGGIRTLYATKITTSTLTDDYVLQGSLVSPKTLSSSGESGWWPAHNTPAEVYLFISGNN